MKKYLVPTFTLVMFWLLPATLYAPNDGPLLPVDIVPDFNRDGVIDDKDRGKVTESEPWRWWINDDDDAGTTDGDDIPGRSNYGDHSGGSLGTAADYGTHNTFGHIDGIRDLVDFFPLYLDIKKLLEIVPPGPNAKYKLKQEDGALNFSYTDLKTNSVGDFLIKRVGTNLDNATMLASWEVHQITSAGFELHWTWLNAVKGGDGYGVILLEGRAKSAKPLVLEVSDSQGKKLVELKFQVSIDGVEQMFRHKNLLAAGGGSGGPPDRLGEPENYPDRLTSTKTFVMLHGYNVNAESARGWGAEMFKRLYWKGSKAKFYNVTWYGSETQILGSLTTNYQANVNNAFATAQQFASFFNALSNVTVAGHSLANMLVGSAIHDWGARPSKYFMIDAAVAKESYDDAEEQLTNGGVMGMEHPAWAGYDRRLWCSDWHTLPFPGGDNRSTLTWENRLENVGIVTAYNFGGSLAWVGKS